MVARFHYDDQIYERLLEDGLTPSDQNGVTEHIEGCAECQSRLEALAEADLPWGDVRRFLQPENEAWPRDAAPSDASLPREARHADNVDFLSPSDDPNSLGRFGRYEIREILGRGGMGVVMRGYDPALDRHSAIKVLAPELATNASARNRFSREAKSAAAVVHEHVVPIQTVDEERGLPYLVMPVVEGTSLEQRVAETGPLTVVEILRIGNQIASGLAAAHAQGLVHRDVKPANVLLENGVERVMITDFGLARAVDDANMTRSGVITGTPQYMSPEQARGDDVDHRSDLFSLGSVLYFMSTGRSPFRAETMMGVLHRIANDTPRPPQKINSDIPSWLQEIIERLLDKEPSQRFRSASDVAELLGKWLAHVQQPDVAPRPASPGKRPRPSNAMNSRSGAKKVVATAAGGLFFLLAAVVIVLELNKGTLVIECDRPEVAIRIMQGDKICERLTVTPGDNSVRLAAGQYIVEIDGEYDGLKIENDVVTVTRGNTHLVRILQVGAVRDAGKPSGETTLPAAVDTAPVLTGLLLDVAVREFNERQDVREAALGQPPLTVEELIASVRWAMMLRKADFSSEQIAGFEVLLNEQRLPKGWKIIHSTRIGPGPSEVFECWSILLRFPHGNHTIRQRMMRQPDGYNETVSVDPESHAGAIPLAAAIREFNETHGSRPVGKEQPPLTEEEVLAAIRWWKHRRNDAPVTNGEFEAFQRIADTRELPKGFEFEVLREFVPGDGYEYVVWSVRIRMQRTAKPGWTYAFGIRERFICCRLIDDGTIAWGKAAENGLQAGVQFLPSQQEYAKGQKVAVRFFFRNTAAESFDISLPNLMTHGYYEEIHVKDPNGKAIFLIQDEGPGGPVGWMKVSMDAGTTRWVNGLPIQIEEGPKDDDVETVISAKPGETCLVSFTLPNFAAPDSEPLNTGEIKFQVGETSAQPQLSVPSADLQGRASGSRRMTPRELPKTTADDLIPADAQPRESDELRDQLARHSARLLPEDGSGSEELRVYIQRFPQEGLLLGDRKQLPRQDWIPADATIYESIHVDIEKLFDSLGTLVDAIVGRAVFDDILDSMRLDPNGPQIDILAICIAHEHLLITHDARLLDKVLPTNPQKAAALSR